MLSGTRSRSHTPRALTPHATHNLMHGQDPVTGSAHAVLGPYWAQRLGKAAGLRARQCSARGGELLVTVDEAAQRVEVVVGAPLGEGGDVDLALGRAPELPVDAWTAIAVLFHDHEWERSLLPWALAGPAFYVGAQGGQMARESRRQMLTASGLSAAQAARLKSPIGLFPGARTPSVLALAVLAEIVAEYEAMVERG